MTTVKKTPMSKEEAYEFIRTRYGRYTTEYLAKQTNSSRARVYYVGRKYGLSARVLSVDEVSLVKELYETHSVSEITRRLPERHKWTVVQKIERMKSNNELPNITRGNVYIGSMQVMNWCDVERDDVWYSLGDGFDVSCIEYLTKAHTNTSAVFGIHHFNAKEPNFCFNRSFDTVKLVAPRGDTFVCKASVKSVIKCLYYGSTDYTSTKLIVKDGKVHEFLDNEKYMDVFTLDGDIRSLQAILSMLRVLNVGKIAITGLKADVMQFGHYCEVSEFISKRLALRLWFIKVYAEDFFNSKSPMAVDRIQIAVEVSNLTKLNKGK